LDIAVRIMKMYKGRLASSRNVEFGYEFSQTDSLKKLKLAIRNSLEEKLSPDSMQGDAASKELIVVDMRILRAKEELDFIEFCAKHRIDIIRVR